MEPLTVREAYLAAYYYVEQYYSRGRHSDDLFLMLHAMELSGEDDMLDPASWNDWLAAVARAKGEPPPESPGGEDWSPPPKKRSWLTRRSRR